MLSQHVNWYFDIFTQIENKKTEAYTANIVRDRHGAVVNFDVEFQEED